MTPTLEIDSLKEDIYDKIADINDENVLLAINTIIDNLDTSSIDKDTYKRDLTCYVKEWVKSF